MNFRLLWNDELWEQGADHASWEVLDPTPRAGHIKLFNRHTHTEAYVPQSEVRAALTQGQLILHRPGAPAVSLAAQSNPALDEALRAAATAVRTVESLQQRYQVSVAKAYQMARAGHEAKGESKEAFPSRATIYRYIAASRRGLPMLRGDANKGNRVPRYSEHLEQLICDFARRLYLVPGSRWTLLRLTADINDAAREQQLLPAGRALSQDFVRRTIQRYLNVDPDAARLDPKEVPAARAIARNRIVSVRIFERVEQDALHLPFVVQTSHGPTSTAYLIHAIDCCTGMVVGWALVVGAPRETDGLQCVEMTLFAEKKQEAFKRLGLNVPWEIWGTPDRLVFDNGPEAKGERMRRLPRLGIDVIHLKSRHPQGKPFIERLNRSLKEALETLPGCTRVNGKDGVRDPQQLGDPLLTVEELEQWIARWYYESWAHTRLERHLHTDFHERARLGATPAQRWTSLTQEHASPMPLSPPLAQWQMVVYDRLQRTLSRKTGLTIEGRRYRGDDLAYLIEKYGEGSVDVLVNPDDYRRVFIDEGNGRPLLALTEEHVTDTTPAYSFAEVNAQLKQARESVAEAPEKTQFRRDINEFSAEAQARSSGKRKRRAEANREVAQKAREAAAVRRAVASPIVIKPAGSSAALAEWSFEDAPSLPVLNRSTGKTKT